MRNLMMRLNARRLEELHRIARFWRVPVSDGPKHRIVGALYRTMTDPRAGRDVWERLGDDERALISHLALTSETALTVAELARHLNLDEQRTHDVAARLYRAGIIAREGDDDPLPIGAVPRLFLPLEVWQLFRRVRDEQDLGDLSDRSLRTLLELLDDPELEEAAGHWGLRVIPGLRQREDLIQQILNLTADSERREAVLAAATRKREARALWEAVLAASERTPNGSGNHSKLVPLAEALSAAGLTSDDDDPAAALRTRSLLDSFESRLLLWHTYDAEGNRYLFIPSEIRNPEHREQVRPTLPAPLGASDVEEPAWRFPDALAWDLLTVLRALSASDAPRGLDPDDFPKTWLRRLNLRLWIAGDDVPPPGYLSFMVTLARDEGLLVVGDRHGTPSLVVGAAVRAWRTRSFPEQTAQLRLRWLSSTGWPEGEAREDLAVEGADWRGFRRKLLAMLAEIEASAPDAEGEGAVATAKDRGETARWYPLEPLAAWLAARDPDLLGETFSAASAGFSGTTGAKRRRSAIANAVIGTITTALNWFGMVEVGVGPDHLPVVRINPAMLTPSTTARPEPKPRAGQRGGPLTVTLDGRIELRVPTPVRVWSLLAFSEPEVLDQVSVYRLTEPALSRALVAGFDVEQVISFLERHTAGELPQPVVEDLRSWAKGFRRVRVRQAVVLRPDDPGVLADLERLAAAAGWEAHRLGEREIVVIVPPEAAERDHLSDLDQVTDALRTAGFHPA